MKKRSINNRQTKLIILALILIIFGVAIGSLSSIILYNIIDDSKIAQKIVDEETNISQNYESNTYEAVTTTKKCESEQDADFEETESYIIEDIPLSEELQHALYNASQYAGISYTLALSVVHQESGYRNVMGDNGESYGYMQIQEKWHKDRMQKLGVDDLMEPYGNFLVGCTLLGDLLRNNDGDIHMALMAYNMGQSGAERTGKSESAYSRAVVQYMEDLENGTV